MNNELLNVSKVVHHWCDVLSGSSIDSGRINELHEATTNILEISGFPQAFYTNVKRAGSLCNAVSAKDTPFEEGLIKLQQCFTKLTKAVDTFLINKFPEEASAVTSSKESLEEDTEAALAAAMSAVPIDDFDEGFDDSIRDEVPADMQDLLLIFISSQQAKFDEFEEMILEFEAGSTSAIQSILRELHTLKGELGVLGLQKFAHLIHSVEQKMNDQTMSADGLFRLKDLISMKLNELAMGENSTIHDYESEMILKVRESVESDLSSTIEDKSINDAPLIKESTKNHETESVENETPVSIEALLTQLEMAHSECTSGASIKELFRPIFKQLRSHYIGAKSPSFSNLLTLVDSFVLEGQIDLAGLQRLTALIHKKVSENSNCDDVVIDEHEMNVVLIGDATQSNSFESSGATQDEMTKADGNSLNLGADKSFLEDFVTESREHLTVIENTLLDLENDPTNAEYLNLIFRGCHTIKGIAGFLELLDIQSLAHNVENLMDKARQNELTLDPPKVDVLLESIDLLKEFIDIVADFISTEKYHVPASYTGIMARLDLSLQNKLDTNSSVQPVVEESNISQKIVEAKKGEGIVEVSETTPKSPTQNKKPAGIDETVRVPIGRLDQLIDTIGEAVIAQSMISADPIMTMHHKSLEGIDVVGFQKKVSAVDQVMRQIQELSMALRTVSIKSTFQKMARLVRDYSKKTGKNIQFVMEGEDTELDKSVVENIADPLMHMIRNSVDHGIELPEEREQMGKVEPARVTLRAFQAAGNINIEIQDNGGGLNVEKIKAKAIKQGLIKAEDQHSDNDIHQLIFHPGFSTAEQISDISGRGVGMDVVRRNIEQSRGSVETYSELGIGTTFVIRLPLTLAIIDGMVVTASNERYIIPTLSILDSLRPDSAQIGTAAGKGEYIDVRGEAITLVRLSDFFGNSRSEKALTDGIVMVVEDMLGKKIGLSVDQILGQQQVVIKSLGEGIGSIDGVSGGAIMSDGKISMILDVGAIVQSVK
ncbi:MAG: chemotaxis protein CheA [Fibrobacterales bacterium]